MGTYWASDEGVERREEMSKDPYRRTDEYLAPRRAGGFGDGRLISTGLNDHHASDAGAVTRQKNSKGASRRLEYISTPSLVI